MLFVLWKWLYWDINTAESSDELCEKKRQTDGRKRDNPISFLVVFIRILLNSRVYRTVTYPKFCNATYECVKVVYSTTRNTSNKKFLSNFIHLKWTTFFFLVAVTSLESFSVAHFYVTTKAFVLFTWNCCRKSPFQPLSISPHFSTVLYRAVTAD
jgi:hypothetical protein